MNIVDKINNLSPMFPETLKEIENFRKKEKHEVEELIKIIEKDTLLIANLLKIVNSPMFGFRSKVETLSRAINLLGMNFTIAIAISQSIKDSFNTNLKAYAISSNDFMNSSILSLIFARLWMDEINYKYKEDILLGTILQEIGKFVISEIVLENGMDMEFIKDIELGCNEISCIEKKYLNITTSQVTAQIFRYWGLSENLIKMIEFVDDIDNCPIEDKQKAQFLNVIKTLFNVNSVMSDKSVEKGLKKAKDFGLDIETLEKVIQILQFKEIK